MFERVGLDLRLKIITAYNRLILFNLSKRHLLKDKLFKS